LVGVNIFTSTTSAEDFIISSLFGIRDHRVALLLRASVHQVYHLTAI
jgi:hypothetical protein